MEYNDITLDEKFSQMDKTQAIYDQMADKYEFKT